MPKESKTVVLIVPGFPKLSETFIFDKFRGLLKQGWDVHVVCSSSDEEDWKRFTTLDEQAALRRRVHVNWRQRPRWLAALLTGLAVPRCLFKNPKGTWRFLSRGWRRFGIDVLRRLYLDAELLCLRPDLIHFEFGGLAVGRMYLKELLNAQVVVSFRGYDLNYAGIENPDHYSEVWQHADALHLLGQDLWRRARERGCPPEKIHALIPPAVDVGFYNAGERRHTEVAGTAARPLRILSVGRLDWRKGYEYALEAVSLLEHQGIAFEYPVIGDGEFLQAIAFSRHQLGLAGTVELLGAQPREEVKKALLWADVFFHSAVSEGFCNAVIEAQAMGLPVVCTDAGGLPENVLNGETGFVVERRAPGPLAEKLIVLARDPELRQQMGERGRRRARDRFNLKDQIAAVNQLYMQTLAATSRNDETTSPHYAVAVAEAREASIQ